MPRNRGSRWVVTLFASVGFIACNTSSDLSDPGIDRQEVQMGARFAAILGTFAITAEQMILDMAAHVAEPTGPRTDFDLGNGITVTMWTEGGGYTFSFSGTTNVEGSTVQVDFGWLRLTPAAEQPSSGSTHMVNSLVRAQDPAGDATWTVTGAVTLDPTGMSIGHDMTMTQSISETGEVTVLVAPSRFDLIITHPHGNTLRFVIDRSSMTGTLAVNGQMVAAVSFAASCAHVNYLDESYQDTNICFVGQA